MNMAWIWPRGMGGRIAVVLVAALLAELAGNMAFDSWRDRELITAEERNELASQLVNASKVAVTVPPENRAQLLQQSGTLAVTFNWVARTVITDFSTSSEQLLELKRRMIETAPVLSERPLRLTLLPSEQAGKRDMVGAMQLADGSFVTFRVSPYLAAPPSAVVTTLAHLLLMAAVLVAAMLIIWAMVRPLRDLAQTADAAGHGQAIDVAIEGPHEVQRVATAFAAMQSRLLNIVEDHTQSLVAVSHDLRTPIQRLRLRASMIDDIEMRDLMTQDLIEMERFIDSTLAYVRRDEEEPVRFVDVAAIALTAVDNAADTGANIDYIGPDILSIMTRPIALKRLLGNLVDNAKRHGKRIEVSLQPVQNGFMLAVDDDGPGIPPDRYSDMLQPFRRMEPSRGRASGGAGLGLAISAKAASIMGGELSLAPSSLGGLRAILRIETAT